MKPISIFGFLLLAFDILKGPTCDAHVIEYAVENDFHIAAMHVSDELQHQFIRGCPYPGGGFARFFFGYELFVA